MLFKKKFKHLCKLIFISTFSLIMAIPLSAQKKAEKETKIMVSKSGIEYKITDWDSRISYNPFSYSYMIWEDPIYTKVKTKEVYPVAVSKFDQPPVYSKECIKDDDPMACSNNKLQQFVASKDFRYTTNGERNMQEGLEYVSFTLNENGKFEDTPTVLTKGNPCKDCAEKAIEIIKESEGQWQPAVLDGKPVKVVLTIPVRFELQEF